MHKRTARKESTLMLLGDDVLGRILNCLLWMDADDNLAANKVGDFRWSVGRALYRYKRVAAFRQTCRRTALLLERVTQVRCWWDTTAAHALLALREADETWSEDARENALFHYRRGHQGGQPCNPQWICAGAWHDRGEELNRTLRMATVALRSCRTAIRFACVHEQLAQAMEMVGDDEDASSRGRWRAGGSRSNAESFSDA